MFRLMSLSLILVSTFSYANISRTRKLKKPKKVTYLYDADDANQLSKKEKLEESPWSASVYYEFASIRDGINYDFIGTSHYMAPNVGLKITPKASFGVTGQFTYETERGRARTHEFQWLDTGVYFNFANILNQKDHGVNLTIRPYLYLLMDNQGKIDRNTNGYGQLRVYLNRQINDWLSLTGQFRAYFYALRDADLQGRVAEYRTYFMPSITFSDKIGLDLILFHKHQEWNQVSGSGKHLTNDQILFSGELGFKLFPKLTWGVAFDTVPYQAHDDTAFSVVDEIGFRTFLNWTFF